MYRWYYAAHMNVAVKMAKQKSKELRDNKKVQ
jgi:hypothetical protein